MIETIRDFSGEHPGIRNIAIATAISLGTYALYKAIKPETTFETGENAFDILAEANVHQSIIDEAGLDVRYVMMGGCAIEALRNPDTKYDFDNKEMIPPDNIEKSQFREDDGTRIDFDALVFAVDHRDPKKPTKMNKVRKALEPDHSIINDPESSPEAVAKEKSKVGYKLKIGVTGLRPGEEYDTDPASLPKKLLHGIMKDWVSHRLEYEDGTRFVTIADVKVQLPDEYFDEVWYLVLKNGQRIPVFHPLIQVLCYTSRASHGTRPRDVPKISEVMPIIGPVFEAELELGKKNQTADVILHNPAIVGKGVMAAARFSEEKNNIRWRNRHTRSDMSTADAALFATRAAIHRQLDTRKFFTQFGRGGWLYDHVISKFSGERQDKVRQK